MTDDLRRLAEAADAVLVYSYGKPEADLDIRDQFLALLDERDRLRAALKVLVADAGPFLTGAPDPIDRQNLQAAIEQAREALAAEEGK